MEKPGYRENLELLMMQFPGKVTLSVNEVAQATSSTIGTIYSAVRRVRNPLPHQKLNGKIIIPIAQLARWLAG